MKLEELEITLTAETMQPFRFKWETNFGFSGTVALEAPLRFAFTTPCCNAYYSATKQRLKCRDCGADQTHMFFPPASFNYESDVLNAIGIAINSYLMADPAELASKDFWDWIDKYVGALTDPLISSLITERFITLLVKFNKVVVEAGWEITHLHDAWVPHQANWVSLIETHSGAMFKP